MSGEGFREQLNEVHRMGLAPVRPLYIDLSVAKPDQEFNISGNFFYVRDSPGQNEFVSVKVNNSSLPAIPWSIQTGFIQPFNRLYITTPAGQTGIMTILIASEATQLFDIIDHRSSISSVMQSVLDELQGVVTAGSFIGVAITAAPGATSILAANANRKGCSIQALSTNSGSVFLGFANTVTVGGAPGVWFCELQAGQPFTIDDYRGPIYGIATAAQVVGTGEW